MNGLPLRSLTPDADAPLITRRSASYCELGFRAIHELSYMSVKFYGSRWLIRRTLNN